MYCSRDSVCGILLWRSKRTKSRVELGLNAHLSGSLHIVSQPFPVLACLCMSGRGSVTPFSQACVLGLSHCPWWSCNEGSRTMEGPSVDLSAGHYVLPYEAGSTCPPCWPALCQPAGSLSEIMDVKGLWGTESTSEEAEVLWVGKTASSLLRETVGLAWLQVRSAPRRQRTGPWFAWAGSETVS